jgi:hypothetical protein
MNFKRVKHRFKKSRQSKDCDVSPSSDAFVSAPLFVKEYGLLQSHAKMDHLICFLPGALALDLLTRNGHFVAAF